MKQPSSDAWWKRGVVYQVYVRSFQDTNGDGVGDLNGVRRRLDHVAGLGATGIWLNPIHPSPNHDWGYDVADYLAIDPELGTLDDFDRLVTAAGERGIGVILDLVPNHTSDVHPWFEEARSSRSSTRRDWYVWADPARDGGPPNNWRSVFGNSAWTLDPATEQYFLHNFLPEQPDLNWWNDEVRDEFDRVLRFWLRRGVSGFRVDVANALVHDRELRDNPSLAPGDHPALARLEQRPVYSFNRPEALEVHRRWRALIDAERPGGVLLGETWVHDPDDFARYYDRGSALHLAFNFRFFDGRLDADELRSILAESLARVPGDWNAWAGSNHDHGRFTTRWCDGDRRRASCALVLLLTLPGTPVLYQGDEIALPDVDVPRERLRDQVGIRNWPREPGRDACRTPMQWSAAAGGGFTDASTEPWLPLGDLGAVNVEAQAADPDSPLTLCRDLIRLRCRSADLGSARYDELAATGATIAYRRGERTAVVLNLSDEPSVTTELAGRIELCTDRQREGEIVAGAVALAGWQAAAIRLR